MAFKTINKLFKGELIQVTPCKGYGYIKPAWNKEELSSKNLYCYYASSTEKQRKKCFLKIFEKGGKYSPHEVKHTYKGEEIWIPSNPQIIFFEVEVEGPNYRCVHLYDERHLTSEEKVLAEANSQTEPDFKALLKEQEAPVEVEASLGSSTEEKEEAPVAGEDSNSKKVEELSTNESSDLVVGEGAPYDAYQDGQDCGKEDYENYHKNLLEQYVLEGLSWQERAEFERGYSNGFDSAQEEELEMKVQSYCLSYKDKEDKSKTFKHKKEREEDTSSKDTEKEASKNKKALKEAKEEAFEAAFSDPGC